MNSNSGLSPAVEPEKNPLTETTEHEKYVDVSVRWTAENLLLSEIIPLIEKGQVRQSVIEVFTRHNIPNFQAIAEAEAMFSKLKSFYSSAGKCGALAEEKAQLEKRKNREISDLCNGFEYCLAEIDEVRNGLNLIASKLGNEEELRIEELQAYGLIVKSLADKIQEIGDRQERELNGAITAAGKAAA